MISLHRLVKFIRFFNFYLNLSLVVYCLNYFSSCIFFVMDENSGFYMTGMMKNVLRYLRNARKQSRTGKEGR